MSSLLLRNGSKMPTVGLGTWKIPKSKASAMVKTALEIGYRLIDCACDYGNEIEVGHGLNEAFKSGIVKREDVWITSKLWCTYHAKSNVRSACLKTLKDLGVSYLDLYLIHFPISLKYVDIETRYPPEWDYDPNKPGIVLENIPTSETWEAMEDLVKEGLVKNIGISNFNCQHIMDLMKYAKIQPSVLQVEIHPYLQQPQLVEYCQRKDISLPITAYSSFGGVSYIPLNNPLAQSTPPLLEHTVVKSIAQKYGKSPAQVLLRWAIDRGLAIIPKSESPERLKENIDVLKFQLDGGDLEKLKQLDQGLRFNDPASYANYPIFG